MILRRNAGPKYKKFLFINPFGIGDVLFTTPVIRAIKDKFPDSFIGYWSNLRVKPLLESNPRINKVFALSRGDIKKLYRESFFKGFWNFWCAGCPVNPIIWGFIRVAYSSISFYHRYHLRIPSFLQVFSGLFCQG